MNPNVAADLGKEELTQFHQELLTFVKGKFAESRRVMSAEYPRWDSYDDVYRGFRYPDKQDIQARDRKEPEKAIVPMTYSQVQTGIAFVFTQMFQKPTFYELSGSGIEDWKAAKIAESTLERDLQYNQWPVLVYRFWLDIFRFGFGVFKHWWSKEMQRQWVKVQGAMEATLFGNPAQMPDRMELQNIVKFLGNRITTISPYKFFPDPRVGVADTKLAEYVGSEEDVTLIWLKKQQANGMFVGVNHLKESFGSKDIEQFAARHATSRTKVGYRDGKLINGHIMGELQFEICPKDWKIEGKPFDDRDYPVKFVANMVSDQRIVRFKELGYLHDEFTYNVGEMSPDKHRLMNQGLSELIAQLQDISTWLFNARITSVRKTVQNHYVADPSMIEMGDLEARSPIIRTKKGAGIMGVDKGIKQLDTQDVTQSHISTDIPAVAALIRLASGISENSAGEYSKGRRSAAQTNTINQATQSRLGMITTLVWHQAKLPLGRNLLSNLRDGLDVEQLVRIHGMQVLAPVDVSSSAPGPADVAQFLGVTKAALVGNYDFDTLDGTLATEKGFISNSLQELLSAIMTNPTAAVIFGMDAKKLLTEIMTLRGIKNPEKFQLMPEQQAQLMTLLSAAGVAADPSQPQQPAGPGESQPPADY